MLLNRTLNAGSMPALLSVPNINHHYLHPASHNETQYLDNILLCSEDLIKHGEYLVLHISAGHKMCV